MITLQLRVLVVAIGMLGMNIAHAQLTIEQLIEQTGIEAGDVAMRDLPGFRSRDDAEGPAQRDRS